MNGIRRGFDITNLTLLCWLVLEWWRCKIMLRLKSEPASKLLTLTPVCRGFLSHRVTATKIALDCSQSPIFPWDRRCRSLSPTGRHLGLLMWAKPRWRSYSLVMQIQNKLSSNYLTSNRLNNVTLEVLEVYSLSIHLERSDYCLERSDYLVERSDQRMERSGLERSGHGTKWP